MKDIVSRLVLSESRMLIILNLQKYFIHIAFPHQIYKLIIATFIFLFMPILYLWGVKRYGLIIGVEFALFYFWMIEFGEVGLFIFIVFKLVFEDVLLFLVHWQIQEILAIWFDLIFHMIHDLLGLSLFNLIQSKGIVLFEIVIINKFQFEEIIFIFRHRIFIFSRTIQF